MIKQRKLITLDNDIMIEINRMNHDDGFNFSNWVEEKFIQEFMNHNLIEKQIDKTENQLEKLKNRKKYLQKVRKTGVKLPLKTLNKGENYHLFESKKVIKKNPEFFEGRLRLWNNTFKDKKLSKIEFMRMLELI